MERKYYAMFDPMATPDSRDGFINSKKAYAFKSKRDRDAFVEYRYWDNSCKAITAKRAKRFRERDWEDKLVVPPYEKDGWHRHYLSVLGVHITGSLGYDGVKNMPKKEGVDESG